MAISRIAEIALSPGSIFAWLVVGIVVGWLAARVMKGGGYGRVGDMIVGVIGAVLGGLGFGLIVTEKPGFWGSLGVAVFGACILIAISRFLGFGRPRI